MNKQKFYIIITLLIALTFSTKVLASLTFGSDVITGTSASTIDVGSGNALSLQTTNNGAITTGTGLVTLGGNLSVAGNAGIGTTTPMGFGEFYKDVNDAAVVNITNPNTGDSAWAELNIRNEVGDTTGGGTGLRFGAQGVGRTTAGAFVQDSGVIEAGTALSGGLSIMARNAAGVIRFYTGSWYDERMRVTSTGNIGIGTETPNANAILDVSSTTKAFMPPRMTTAQRNDIASPTAGMVIYNSTTNKLNVYTTAWEEMTSS